MSSGIVESVALTNAGQPARLKGYWWQSDRDSTHTEKNFSRVGTKARLVALFYELANKDWRQELLNPGCIICEAGKMQLTYDFPHKLTPFRLTLNHAVGLKDYLPSYLPMIWSATAAGKGEEWFDFKYVGRSAKRQYESLGLARPAAFSKSKLKELFDRYREVVGHDLLAG